MILLIYIASIIAFCVAAWILPLLLMPIVRVTQRDDEIIPPTDFRILALFAGSAIILLYLTRFVWAKWGYDTGWLFPTIVAVLHFMMGGAKGANRENQAQAYGVVFGVIIYAVFGLF